MASAVGLVGSYRVTPIALATGQAAGVAAALAAQTGVAPRDLPAGDVQRKLIEQGANLGESVTRSQLAPLRTSARPAN